MQFARARIGIGPTDAVLDREDLPQRAADSAVARREGRQYTPDPRSRARTSMKIHVPDGIACTTAAEAEKAFQDLGAPLAVVKAQIHAGGRGKGGRRQARAFGGRGARGGRAEARQGTDHAPERAAGRIVQRLLVEKGSSIAKEYYLAVAIDRETKKPVIMGSSEGGMDIEAVAANTPEKIVKVPFSAAKGFRPPGRAEDRPRRRRLGARDNPGQRRRLNGRRSINPRRSGPDTGEPYPFIHLRPVVHRCRIKRPKERHQRVNGVGVRRSSAHSQDWVVGTY